MSISRRDFLKNAGVAVLAVAAAGVLAGCSKDEIPEIPGVSKEVDILYKVGKETVYHDRILVLADAEVVAVEELKIPEGYKLKEGQTGPFAIETGEKYPYNVIELQVEEI